jgi:hypothetical protein
MTDPKRLPPLRQFGLLADCRPSKGASSRTIPVDNPVDNPGRQSWEDRAGKTALGKTALRKTALGESPQTKAGRHGGCPAGGSALAGSLPVWRCRGAAAFGQSRSLGRTQQIHHRRPAGIAAPRSAQRPGPGPSAGLRPQAQRPWPQAQGRKTQIQRWPQAQRPGPRPGLRRI